MSNALKSQGVKLEIQTAAGPPAVLSPVGEVKTIGDIDSGQAADIDVTHLQSDAKEYLIGLKDAGTITLEGNLVPDDIGQVEMRTARDDQAIRSFKITLTDATPTTLSFDAFVKQFATSAGVDSSLPFNASLRVTGEVVWAP